MIAYGTILGAVCAAAIALANKYDTQKYLTATDWVVAVAGVGGAIASQLGILATRVGANSSLVYTPSGIPGPNKEDLDEEIAIAQSECSDSPDLLNEFPGE